MAKVLMIGAGGVATVAAFKIAQNADVFTDFMIASRRKAKCDKIVDDIHKAGYQMSETEAILTMLDKCSPAKRHYALELLKLYLKSADVE